MPRCTATNRSGKRCKNNQLDGSLYCSTHKGLCEASAMDDGLDLASLFDDEVVETHAPDPVLVPVPASPQATESIQNIHVEHQQNVYNNIFQLHDIDAMIDEITAKLSKLNKVKRVISSANAEIESKARWMFYHGNKHNPTLIGDLRTKLMSSGLYLIKNNKEVLPYSFVKEYTDNAFNALSMEERDKYYERARSKVYGKVNTARAQLFLQH